MTTVLITGAGGYVGSRLAETLAGTDAISVRALSHRESPYVKADEQVVGDLLADAGAVRAACKGVDAVVHLAGPNELVAATDPDLALSATTIATRHLLDAAASACVRRVVYVSTVHVYGALMVPGAVLTEELVPAPRTVYAIARLTCEHLVEVAGDRGMETVVFRLTNSVGAPAHASVQRWTPVANDLCRQAVTTGEMRLRSSGLQGRDFVALGDVCRVIGACAVPGSLPPGTYNLASGRFSTIRELASLVADACESQGLARPSLVLPDDRSTPDSSKAGAEGPIGPYRVAEERLRSYGWQATTPLADAVAETVRFCVEHREHL